MTSSERALWEIIRRRQTKYRFHRQKVIAGWIFDFWCPELELVVELDGRLHDYSLNDEKDQFLKGKGITVWRIWSRNVFNLGFEEWFKKRIFDYAAQKKLDKKSVFPL